MTTCLSTISPSYANGNRCGHQRAYPLFFTPPVHHMKRPYVLEQAKKNIESLYWYPHKWMNRARQIRSERREAWVRFSQTLLHYMDLVTHTISIGGRHLTMKSIAKHANLSFRRAKRTEKELIKEGHLKITKRFDYKKGRFIGIASIRTLTHKFFKDLKISLKHLYNEKIKRESGHRNLIIKQEIHASTIQDSKHKGREWARFVKNILNKPKPPD